MPKGSVPKDKTKNAKKSVTPRQRPATCDFTDSNKTFVGQVAYNNQLPELVPHFTQYLTLQTGGEIDPDRARHLATVMASEIERRLPKGQMFNAALVLADFITTAHQKAESANLVALRKAVKGCGASWDNLLNASDYIMSVSARSRLEAIDIEIAQVRQDRMGIVEMQKRHPEVKGGKALEGKLNKLYQERTQILEFYPEHNGADDE